MPAKLPAVASSLAFLYLPCIQPYSNHDPLSNPPPLTSATSYLPVSIARTCMALDRNRKPLFTFLGLVSRDSHCSHSQLRFTRNLDSSPQLGFPHRGLILSITSSRGHRYLTLRRHLLPSFGLYPEVRLWYHVTIMLGCPQDHGSCWSGYGWGLKRNLISLLVGLSRYWRVQPRILYMNLTLHGPNLLSKLRYINTALSSFL